MITAAPAEDVVAVRNADILNKLGLQAWYENILNERQNRDGATASTINALIYQCLISQFDDSFKQREALLSQEQYEDVVERLRKLGCPHAVGALQNARDTRQGIVRGP